MARVIVFDERDAIGDLLVSRLMESRSVESCQRSPQLEDGFGGELSGGCAGFLKDNAVDTIVYSPALGGPRQMAPDLAEAESLLRQWANPAIKRVVVLSSAAIYGASPHNPGLIPESRPLNHNGKSSIASQWADLEAMASIYLGGHRATSLTILRTAPTPAPGEEDYFSRLLTGRVAITLPGHDPSIQLLSPEDLARAVRSAVESGVSGIFNVAPSGVIPLRAALRLAGVARVPLARWAQRVGRAALAPLGLARPLDQLEYVRYSWTISDKKVREELGFIPEKSSADTVIEISSRGRGPERETDARAAAEFDDFGMDKDYIAAYGRTLFTFLHRYYWRVEVNGLERVPREGRAVLVGVHRGLMPWDGVMALHLLAQRTGRYPRFLIHPTLIKFPFLFNFMTKLGGIVACQENADYVLERDGMLGIFPEGINGAFMLYRDAYRLGKFGRDEFVKMALRNRAPIVPFITIGSAEIFPILKKLNWRWWRRYTEWPCFPVTPTFPLLPIPLPSKWHTQFLAPIHVEERHPPEAADDPVIVRVISNEVRSKMENAIERILKLRKSIFYGSVFGQEAS